MKKRINLLRGYRAFNDNEGIFAKIRSLIVFFFSLILIVNLIIFYLLFKQNQNIAEYAEQKKLFAEYFIQNKEAEAKFTYFRNKEKQLKDILKQDVSFYPYYNLLKESLENFAVGAILNSVTIDKTKSANFSISFENYENLIAFLKYAESDDFLKNFNQLSMVNFSKNELQLTKKDYRLNFKGKFINLNAQQ